MDEHAQTLRVRINRSRAEAEQLLAEFDASGLKRAEFCRKHGLSVDTLDRYRRRRARGQAVLGSHLLAVEVCGATEAAAPRDSVAGSGLAVVLPGGRRIEIGYRFDASTLVQLLDVLERR